MMLQPPNHDQEQQQQTAATTTPHYLHTLLPPRLPPNCPPVQIAFQGVTHYHTLEARDRFGNLLDTYTDDGFTAYLVGTPDPRAGREKYDPVTVEAVVTKATDARGKIIASFTPDVAGSYVMNNEYTGPGGLLATFYRTKDFTDPVLQNVANMLEVRSSDLNAFFFHVCVPLFSFIGVLLVGNVTCFQLCFFFSSRDNCAPVQGQLFFTQLSREISLLSDPELPSPTVARSMDKSHVFERDRTRCCMYGSNFQHKVLKPKSSSHLHLSREMMSTRDRTVHIHGVCVKYTCDFASDAPSLHAPIRSPGTVSRAGFLSVYDGPGM